MLISAKTLLATVAIVAYLVLTWFLASWLHLAGAKLWLLRAVMLGAGLAALGVIRWWSRSRRKPTAEAEEAPAGGPARDEIGYLIRSAEAKLRASKVAGARIGALPAIFLVGETGSGKTYAALNCGLEPEHLAGQVFHDGAVAPTNSLNLWFARRAVLVEAAGALLNQPAGWAYAVRRLAPAKLRSILGGVRQAPRAVVVCFDCETFTRSASIDSITAAAKVLQSRLREASAILGSSLPVYVLFTKTDAIPFFAEYAGALSTPEASQVLGVTLPVQDYRTGLYAEEQSGRLTLAFDQIFYSLSDHRAEYLAREQDPSRLPAIYEFPREFRKLLRAPLVQMLVELCRPSQLSTGPFLRGFYFTGVRMVLEEASPVAARAARAPTPGATADAASSVTQMFNAGALQQAARAQSQAEEAPPGATRVFDIRSLTGGEGTGLASGLDQPAQPRWVPQWSFLSHIFGDVLLQDRAALGASGSSTRVSFWRRFLLATAAAVFLTCAVGFTVSYVRNHSLVDQVREAQAASFTAPAPNQAPNSSDLQRLDKIGKLVDTLDGYRRGGTPFLLGWGLYVGKGLYAPACQAYARGFQTLLLGATQASMVASLKALNYTSPADPYDAPYTTLKTYLVTTSEGKHATEDSTLASDLHARWPAAQNAGSEVQRGADAQFERYRAQLAGGDAVACFSSTPDPDAVATGQAYLNRFPPDQRIYQAMLTYAASRAQKGIEFKQYADLAVTDAYIVPPAFTGHGWTAMKDAWARAEQYRAGESWVLGKQPNEVDDPQTYLPEVQKRYKDDFTAQWLAFIKAGKFTGYRNSGDFAPKIKKLGGAHSALLMVLCLASNNTNVGEMGVANAFSSARGLVPSKCEDKVTGQENKTYTDSLFELGSCVDKIVRDTTPDSRDADKRECAGKVEDTKGAVARLVAGSSGIDQVDRAVENLLMAPIQSGVLENLIKVAPPAGAKGLCDGWAALRATFPSTVTLDDFERIFKPGVGLLDKFKPPAENPNAAYASFWNSMDAIRKDLYPNESKTLQMQYTITAQTSPGVGGFSLTIGGQTLNTFSAKQFVWTGSASETVQLTVGGSSLPASGPFGVFKFVADNAENGHLSGQTYNFSIPVTQGLGKQTTSLGKLNLSLNAKDATVLFTSGWAARLHCTANMKQQ